ncbi:hypothetical protein BDP27DRAFT_605419 [Rhodocollybia butyracea]|uniref:Uncharacterized protein n=1 Tax=Rhodocollybia butyracea TaxID=206335 RepID=A0A9P5QBD3_9AGAR|nr:hypothetical protein BDP27DRAFT_605419 [Rhodocollybia butyracea]
MALKVYLTGQDLRLFINSPEDPTKDLVPLSHEHGLYKLCDELFCFLNGDTDHAKKCRALFEKIFGIRGDPEAARQTTSFLSNPPAIIFGPIQKDYGFHERVDHLANVIFVNDLTWIKYYLCFDADPSSPKTMAAYEVLKAVVLHETGHCAVSQVLGATEFDVATIGLTPLPSLSLADIMELERYRDNDIRKRSTPKLLTAPWMTEGEAGYWLEYEVYGGVVELDENYRAILQTSDKNFHLLDSEILQKARHEIVINF